MDYEYKIFIASKKIQYLVLQTSSQICHMAGYAKACEQHDYQQIIFYYCFTHAHMLLVHNLQYHSNT